MMINDQQQKTQKVLARYVLLVLLASLVINTLSAYIRHVEAGLGCESRPECYGLIGSYVSPDNELEIAQKALAPTEVAKKMHRSIATLLVIAALLLVHQTRKPGAMTGVSAALPYALLAVLLLLSVVGPASYLKTMPAIVVVNLLGGLALLIICWWMWLQLSRSEAAVAAAWVKNLARIGWALLVVQIFLGAWVSGNFAGLACADLLNCAPLNEYAEQGKSSFWYFRELTLDSNGRVLFDDSAVTIHLAHRAGAVITGLVLLIAAAASMSYQKKISIYVVLLVLLQWLIGATGILLTLPLLLVMAHNIIAAVLLLAVTTLNYRFLQAE